MIEHFSAKYYKNAKPPGATNTERLHIDFSRGCSGAPDLIFEIASPSSRKLDYGLKNMIYLQAGVREYWIVDPAKEKVVVYCYEHDSDPCLYSFDSDIPVGIYEGLTIKINTLLETY